MRADVRVRAAQTGDLHAVIRLYEDVCRHVEENNPIAWWKREVYPTAQTAREGLEAPTLYVAEAQARLAGAVILNQTPEAGYAGIAWPSGARDEQALVVHTLCVHPDFAGRGVGRALLSFAVDLAADRDLAAVRLDVWDGNARAIALYEACGFIWVAQADLGYGQYGLHTYRLYERSAKKTNVL